MDLFDVAFINLWRNLNAHGVRYILVGGFAANFHGHQRYTGDVDLYIDDSPVNRKNLRKAYAAYGMGDYPLFETVQFVPGWVDFPLGNGVKLDIMTTLKGVTATFDECLQIAPTITIEDVTVPYLHINHLIANKKAVSRPKDQFDVSELEKIKQMKEGNSPSRS